MIGQEVLAEMPDPDRMEPPALAGVYRHWLAVRGDQPYPHRDDLDPKAMQPALGYLALAEIEDPFRVRYRLVGTRLVDLYGEELTNRYVDEVYTSGRVRRDVLDAYAQVVNTGRPHYTKRVFNLIIKTYGYYRLLLPLAWKSGAVDMVLVVIYPTNPDLRTADQWRSLANLNEFLGNDPPPAA